ncbi:MAG: YkgJ family cysteine cluster protein [Desulfatiglandaceae bacterium]
MQSAKQVFKDHCTRCGECCQASSPTLQREDVPKVMAGVIPWRDLYTLRAGEPVTDNVRGGVHSLDQELLKLRETARGACLYYDEAEKACRVYEHRPVQCAAQKCWDDGDFMKVHAQPKATRKDLLQDPGLLRLVQAHEERCSIIELDRWVKQIQSEGESAVTQVLGMLKFDHDLRQMIPERLEIASEETDLILGRPLVRIIERFGLKVAREADGSFLLTVLEPSDG